MKRFTMADLARELGLSQATVSRALRNHDSVTEATRERVRSAARKMGYTPNPLVSALMESRRRRQAGREVRITYIEADRSGNQQLRTGPMYQKLYQGMAARATELGYLLDRMDAFEPGIQLSRFRSILESRGIENVIVSPLLGGVSKLDLGYGRLRTVSVGLSLTEPALHRIRANHYANAETVLSEVAKMGYRRIGYVHDKAGSARLGNRWLAAYLASSQMSEAIFHAPPLLTADGLVDLDSVLAEYIQRHRLDVLLTPDHRRILPALKRCGVEVPKDIALASVNASGGEEGLTGIDEDHFRQGVEAVNLLVGEMLHGEFGIPQTPREVVVPGCWVPRETAPVQ